MDKDNGGPAFPTLQAVGDRMLSDGGLSVRDYFAAKALPAYFSDGQSHDRLFDAAKWAYEAADAMLKERAK